MTPMQSDLPVTITLAAQDWNTVLGALGEAPYRLAAPVVQRIVEQVQQQQAPPLASAAQPNGADHAPN
jgi:hypothetical protein